MEMLLLRGEAQKVVQFIDQTAARGHHVAKRAEHQGEQGVLSHASREVSRQGGMTRETWGSRGADMSHQNKATDLQHYQATTRRGVLKTCPPTAAHRGCCRSLLLAGRVHCACLVGARHSSCVGECANCVSYGCDRDCLRCADCQVTQGAGQQGWIRCAQ